MTSKKEKKEAIAKELHSLFKKQKKLSEELGEVNKKITDKKTKALDLFNAGHHVIADLLVIVEEITKKGSKSVSWKSIAEELRLSAEEINNKLIKQGMDEPTSKKFFSRIKKEYEKLTDEHTRLPVPSTVTTIEVKKPS